ncbi:MAG: hypothetical protein IOD15_00670 [Phycisphaerales bacterium]|nr:hypothetical protein [Phycisphaerales bacterium]
MHTPRRARFTPCSPIAGPAAVALLALAGLTLPGCNIVGPAILLVHGPEKAKAAYILPEARPTVVFIDDRENLMGTRAARDAMGKAADDALLKSKAATDVIQSRMTQVAVRSDRRDNLMTITEVGRAVKADVVIYVRVRSFALSQDGQSFSPLADLGIRVVDAVADEQLWPPKEADEREFLLAVRPRGGVTPLPANRAEDLQARINLAQAAGLAVAQVFYEHEVRERPGGSLEETRSRAGEVR